jgi:amino acid adenylation domain-containing protein
MAHFEQSARRGPRAALTGRERELPAVAVLELIAQHAGARPGATAVVGGGRSLTYAELDAASSALADRLRTAGVAAGDVVGVSVGRSVELPVALLAAWKAEAVYLPLEPTHPQERTSFVLDDAGATAIIRRAEGDAEAELEVTTLPPRTTAHGDDDRGGRVAGAYIIYTSGSTGQPKGVRASHRSLVNVVLELADTFSCGPDDVWFSMAPPTFDIVMAELCVPLATGARLILSSDQDLRDAKALVRSIRQHGVTRMQAVPSQWRALLDAGFDEPALTAMSGGEALSVDLANRLRERVAALFNGYGPTETTVLSTLWPVPRNASFISIGAPITNTQIYVLDDDLESVATGEAGELCIGGAGVAEGYVRRPDLTAQRFTENALYRTGDRVRCRPDGLLEYLGRDDDQIKVRGQRVEAGEVESRLAGHPGVEQAAVATDGGALVAFVIERPGTAVTATELREHARQTLPEAMVPTRFVVLDRFPLTDNGKIDRHELTAKHLDRLDLYLSMPDTAGEAGPEAGTTVSILCEICREALDVPAVIPDDDLFDLGAHSLSLMQIIARIETQWGVELSVDLFYDAESVADIAAAIETATAAAA